MIDNFVRVLTFVCPLGCGLVAGIFFAFSTFVMKALARLLPEQGIAAMHAINVAVLNRWFFAAFFGTAAGCLLLIMFSLLSWHAAGAVYQLIGCGLYLVGTILVTILFNVPRNDALAAVEASSAGADQWAQYVPRLDRLESRSRCRSLRGRRRADRRPLFDRGPRDQRDTQCFD